MIVPPGSHDSGLMNACVCVASVTVYVTPAHMFQDGVWSGDGDSDVETSFIGRLQL